MKFTLARSALPLALPAFVVSLSDTHEHMSGFDRLTNFYRLSQAHGVRNLHPSLNAGFAAQGFAAMNVFRRTQLVTALLPLLALPTLVQAESADPKMDACIEAFVNSNVDKDRTVTVRKLASFGTAVDPHARHQTIFISARTKHSGKRVAQGTCVIDGDEMVLTMNGKPTQTTKLAQAAAVKSNR
jgi:hypothetical protein